MTIRADIVGSLLRPDYLARARAQFESGELAPAAYKEIEDRAVDQVIAMQEGAGMDVVTDGELRRHTFIDQLLEAVVGLTPDPEGSASDHIPVPFYDEDGSEQSVFRIPISVTDKVRRARMMTVEEYAYARARAHRPIKVTLPSPLMLFLAWSPGRSRDAYADPFELFADGLTLMREEAQELARMGCPYIQIDAPDFGQLIDPSQQTVWAAAGIPFERVMTEGAEMLNEVASVPGVTFGLHICKGNYDSHWISAGGYESIASELFPRLTNYDRILLEYENERSGSFEPLKDLPDDKVVVLGLVTTKTSELEPMTQIRARLDQASAVIDKERLAISPQCGFATSVEGNAITEEAERAKLEQLVRAAAQFLG